MHGNKEIGLIAIGNIGTALECDENIALSRINDTHIRTILFDQSTKGQGNIKINIFLFGERTNGTGIFSAVTGIDHQHKTSIPATGCRRKAS